MFVGYLWNHPNLYNKYKSRRIEKTTFTQDIWHFYYWLGREMYESGIRTFDDVTTYSFLDSRPNEKQKQKLFKLYEDYGGFEIIDEVRQECDKDKNNDEFHIGEIQKYEALRKFQKEGLININDKELISKLVKMNLKQIQMYFQYKYKSIFMNSNNGEVVEYNLLDDLYDTIDDLQKGEEAGIPLYDSPRLTKKINGLKLGNLIYLVLSSGVGKSSFITEKVVLSLLQNSEKGIMFINEEDIKRWRARLLVTVASNIVRKYVNRDIVNRGGFSDEVKNRLEEAADWLSKHRPDMIKFCSLKKYRVEDVINRIELYRPQGFKYVLFDTFKPDLSQNIDRWLAFSNSAQNLYDCIKPESFNCSTVATVQLKIGKERRYLDLESVGKSLEIVEVADVVLAGRRIFADEYTNEKNELKPYNYEKDEFTGQWIKTEYILNPDKNYIVLFLPKNREGSVDEQIIFEVNYDLNVWKEVAYVQVPNYGSSVY